MRVLISEAEIAARVEALAGEIAQRSPGDLVTSRCSRERLYLSPTSHARSGPTKTRRPHEGDLRAAPGNPALA